MTQFLDTYAILGVLMDEPACRRLKGTLGYTHAMNELEAMVRLLRGGDPSPLSTVRKLGLRLLPSRDVDLLNAARPKVEAAQTQRPLSDVDALGYALARRLGLPFVTGDNAFRGREGVDFLT